LDAPPFAAPLAPFAPALEFTVPAPPPEPAQTPLPHVVDPAAEVTPALPADGAPP
jgi:hypothetical protein